MKYVISQHCASTTGLVFTFNGANMKLSYAPGVYMLCSGWFRAVSGRYPDGSGLVVVSNNLLVTQKMSKHSTEPGLVLDGC